jgi:deoxyribonuclease-4
LGHLAQELEHCIDIAGVRGAKPLVPTMYFGAHVSIAGGFDKCIDRIVSLGGNSLMTFASSPRSLQTRPISEHEIKLYTDKKTKFKIGPHFLHAVCLVNLASDNKNYVKVSTNSLIFYQRLVGQIESAGTIFHIGSHKGRGLSETIDQIVSAINFILDSSPKNARLILENSAGLSGTVGSSFSELGEIIGRIGDKSKLGVCLDTQHAFASGYTLDKVIGEFHKHIGLKHLSVIHLNDSLVDFNSSRDRHANWGEGKIGIENLKPFINDPRLKNIPFILETPGTNHSGPRKQDIDLLKSLVLK